MQETKQQERKMYPRPPIPEAEYERVMGIENQVNDFYESRVVKLEARLRQLIRKVGEYDAALAEELDDAYLAIDDQWSQEDGDMLVVVWDAAKREGFRQGVRHMLDLLLTLHDDEHASTYLRRLAQSPPEMSKEDG